MVLCDVRLAYFFASPLQDRDFRVFYMQAQDSQVLIKTFRCHVRVVYKSRQPAKFVGFSFRFCRLLSLLHESRYVQEMMFIRSPNCLLFTKLRLIKNLKKMPHALKNEMNKWVHGNSPARPQLCEIVKTGETHGF